MRMLYFKYRKFIAIFKYIQKRKSLERIELDLENKYGTVANEALSILRAEGGIIPCGIFNETKNRARLDAIVLEYEDKCSTAFWGFVKWTIGTLIAIAGLFITYLSFVK